MISRKPHGAAAAERQVEALINKGGSAPTTEPRAVRTATSQVLLRMPKDLLSRVDHAVAARPLPTTRHAWILEAVLERLRQEE